MSYFCYVLIRVLQKVGRLIVRRICAHGAEFVQVKIFLMDSYSFLRKKDRHLHDVCLCGIFHPLFLILLFYDLFQLFSNFLIRYLDAKLLKPAVMQMLICFC